jgi:thiamine biosynthesis lipoprotein
MQRARVALGTLVAIEVTASGEALAFAAIESAFEAIAAVDERMHPSRAQSDIARINGAPTGAFVHLDVSTWSVLRLAQRVHAASGGTFDPCLPTRAGGLTDLELSTESHGGCWARCHCPLWLDLGGIAKGYAVDVAIGALARSGCVTGLVNAGGDLRVFGARSERVLLRRPDGVREGLVLEGSALAVSDREASQRPREHRGYYRRTEDGALRPYAAVLAPEAAVADALTKCVLVGTQAQAAHALQAFGGVELTGALDSAAAEPHLRPLRY